MDYPNGHNVISEVLKSEKPFTALVRGRCNTEEQSERCNFSGFEDGQRGPGARKVGSLQEVKKQTDKQKTKETDSSLEHPEGNTAPCKTP